MEQPERVEGKEVKYKCGLCCREVKEEELDKYYKVPICNRCARDLQFYGTD